MDLEENIRVAAEVYAKPNYTPDTESSDLVVRSFIAGAKSQAAKDFWINSKEAEEYWKKKLL